MVGIITIPVNEPDFMCVTLSGSSMSQTMEGCTFGMMDVGVIGTVVIVMAWPDLGAILLSEQPGVHSIDATMRDRDLWIDLPNR